MKRPTPARHTTRCRLLSSAIALAVVASIAAACGNGAAITICLPDDGPTAAQIWNEQALEAIRRDFPAPTVHARNLYHLSAVAWDVQAAVDGSVQPLFIGTDEMPWTPGSLGESDRLATISEALSVASHRLLVHRYTPAAGSEVTVAALDQQLADLCLDSTDPGDTAGALGAAVAEAVIKQTRLDGSNEPSGYVDLDYAPVNPPLKVTDPGTELIDPNRWQPLSLEERVTRNGQVLAGDVQISVGPNWGQVAGFALPPYDDELLRIEPGPPPLLGEMSEDDGNEYKRQALDVVRYSAALDATADSTLTLGQLTVPEGDYGRVIAEYWADGPDSETPPGHWNTLAHQVSDRVEAADGLQIDGEPVTRLDWDITLGVALNGALHDAAIAAWGAKGHFDYVRPISMIRYLAAEGQLPLEDGLSETITAESSADGERHEHLNEFVGEVALWAWRGGPEDPETETSGVGWIRAAEWVPYQRPTFVTPSFAAYVSGHSTFSRAGAVILAQMVGSDEIPGGPLTWTVGRGDLIHEEGPSTTVVLEWPTFSAAAEEAGISRFYGGIHIQADHDGGVLIGEQVARDAWDRVEMRRNR